MTTASQFLNNKVDQGNVFTIPAGQTQTTQPFDCGGTQICGLYVDTVNLSGANITFLASNSPVYDAAEVWDGATPAPARVNYTVSTSCATTLESIPIAPAVFAFAKYIWVVTDIAPIADATIIFAARTT